MIIFNHEKNWYIYSYKDWYVKIHHTPPPSTLETPSPPLPPPQAPARQNKFITFFFLFFCIVLKSCRVSSLYETQDVNMMHTRKGTFIFWYIYLSLWFHIFTKDFRTFSRATLPDIRWFPSMRSCRVERVIVHPPVSCALWESRLEKWDKMCIWFGHFYLLSSCFFFISFLSFLYRILAAFCLHQI